MQSTIPGTLKSLRKTATGLLRERAAIFILGNHPNRPCLQDVAAEAASLQNSKSTRELRARISQLQSTVEKLRDHYGVRAPQEKLLWLLEWIDKEIEPGDVGYIPVAELSEYLSYYERYGLKPHARVSIDVQGIGKDYPGDFEVKLLEASLFEDMCALFNLVHEAHLNLPRSKSVGSLEYKIAAKRHASLMRATLSAAFYFVEGYANCLATDFLHSRTIAVSEKERELLTEWDSQKKRSRTVTTRDKLVKYPRILTGATSPPVHEDNCPELKYFVSVAKNFRDAIVHASAKLEYREDEVMKENLLIQLDHGEVIKIVDTAVSLVRRIEVCVHGKGQPWLHDRAADGFFQNEVFE